MTIQVLEIRHDARGNTVWKAWPRFEMEQPEQAAREIEADSSDTRRWLWRNYDHGMSFLNLNACGDVGDRFLAELYEAELWLLERHQLFAQGHVNQIAPRPIMPVEDWSVGLAAWGMYEGSQPLANYTEGGARVLTCVYYVRDDAVSDDGE
jgi:hypothetical protein